MKGSSIALEHDPPSPTKEVKEEEFAAWKGGDSRLARLRRARRPSPPLPRGAAPPEPPALFFRTIFDLFSGGAFWVFWGPDWLILPLIWILP